LAAAQPERTKTAAVRNGAPLASTRQAGSDAPAQNLERPAFLRRINGQPEAQERLGLALDDEWDVPTFLRKRAD
jgi:cell division protein FtsZ